MATKNPTTTRLEPGTHEEYARCTHCNRESIRGEDDILHTEDCPERDHE